MTAFLPRAKASRLGLALIAGLAIAGCAAAPDPTDKDAVAEFEEINDPIEPTNRAIFKANRVVDKAVLKPVAFVYKEYTPAFLQKSVFNLLNNLRAPVIFFNDVLQGELQRAGTTLVRFVINSTVGIGGLRDQAGPWGFEHHSEDFGQTLAVWRVPEGPFIMLPILGPSNPRDTVGLVVDYLIDPLNIWLTNTNREEWIYVRTGMRIVDERARNYDVLEDLERSSLDFYAAMRSSYRQRREDEIGQGKSTATLPAPGLSETPITPDAAGEEAARTY